MPSIMSTQIPRFLPTPTNVTYRRGQLATLRCSVDKLGTKFVSVIYFAFPIFSTYPSPCDPRGKNSYHIVHPRETKMHTYINRKYVYKRCVNLLKSCSTYDKNQRIFVPQIWAEFHIFSYLYKHIFSQNLYIIHAAIFFHSSNVLLWFSLVLVNTTNK